MYMKQIINKTKFQTVGNDDEDNSDVGAKEEKKEREDEREKIVRIINKRGFTC